MEFKDYYKILGVPKDASQKDIQKAYRKLAREHHPDVNKGEGSELKFKEIGEAYDVLKDPEKRAKYDRYGAAWKQAAQGSQAPPGFEGVHFDFSGGGQSAGDAGQYETFFDLLDQMFGGRAQSPFGGQPGFGGQTGGRRGPSFGGRGGFQWQAKGQDHEATLRVTMEEAARGAQKHVTLTDPDTGTNRTFNLKIPAGSLPGQRIRLSGQGGQGRSGGEAGDLYLRLDFEPHPRFRLEGHDLHTTVRLAPWQAALGTRVEVDTLQGTVRARVPAGTSSGRQIRLKGKGFPAKAGAGDLYIAVEIEVPSRLTDEERALYEKLREASEHER